MNGYALFFVGCAALGIPAMLLFWLLDSPAPPFRPETSPSGRLTSSARLLFRRVGLSQFPMLGPFGWVKIAELSQFQGKHCDERARIARPPKWVGQEEAVVNIYEAGPFEGRLLQWPVLATSGALEVRLAETDHEVRHAQHLRYQVFYEEKSAMPTGEMRAARRDFDKYDDVCDHLLVVDRDAHDEDGQPLVVGTYRLTREKDAEKVGGFYTAGEFDLGRMISGMPKGTKYLELGRSCILPSYRSRPGTMQLLWKGLLAYVARFDIDLMFGCASLPGTDVTAMALPLSYLHPFPSHARAVHGEGAGGTACRRWTACPRTPSTCAKAFAVCRRCSKGYVRAGCCIGDGAVVDHQFDTTDVFIFFPLSGIDARYQSRFGLVK